MSALVAVAELRATAGLQLRNIHNERQERVGGAVCALWYSREYTGYMYDGFDGLLDP